jgi:acyl-CoA synthetase (AMP-forming)/AMP-acid ligase II/acyl carrier protein
MNQSHRFTFGVAPYKSLPDLLQAQAQRNPQAIAIAAPGRNPLTYGRLQTLLERVIRTLQAAGVGRGDRVALVLPNSPEMAVAFLAVASAATSAPLNPAYREEEFEFYFTDLKVKAIILEHGSDSPARKVAQAHGLMILELCPEPEAPAGAFCLAGGNGFSSARPSDARPEDVALLLHTSGTTARPKIVPLTQVNLCTSAHNIRLALDLIETDRCLNVMPLFHIHGLVGGILSSFMAGASVVCAPGFYAPKFFAWAEEFRPTWYTAVPTMHQSILARAADHRQVIEHCSLRFIRSSSSALPPQVMMELEETFRVPVIESYGMTEAAHQMASNPLPPRMRKPGSVGVAAGPEVAIMDEAGTLFPPGQTGEIVIRGANVAGGYENNPAANQTAFTQGWFRTGDQGHLDVDGYLFISGRIKEIINRGGEKISPREVDEVLLDHPAVAQAVTFAVPHSTLGEDIAAAIVLKANVSMTAREIREFAAGRLATFKVPGQVVFVDEIPKGPTGKIQRIGLAERLGLDRPTPTDRDEGKPFIEPRTPVEQALGSVWRAVLGLRKVSVHDRFLDLGGDSMLATQIVSRLRQELQLEVSLASFFYANTIQEQARIVETMLLHEEVVSPDNAEQIRM